MPPPSSKPDVTSGGNNATATMTPIKAADTPVVNASEPALPDANATAMSPKSIPERDTISGVAGFTCNSTPIATDNTIAAAIPASAVSSPCQSRARSPNVVPSDSATFGPE